MLRRKTSMPAASPWVRRPKPGAFTLIELLVVMAILAGLAAILIPIITAARRAAKLAAAKHLIGQIESAIDSFENDWGYNPPDRIPSGTMVKFFDERGANPDYDASRFPAPESGFSSEALYYCLGNAYATAHNPYIELQADKQVTDVARTDPEYGEISAENGLPEIVDPWDRPFVYHRPPFPTGAALPSVFMDQDGKPLSLSGFDDGVDPTYNPDAYDLFSYGPPNMPDPRLITNWE